MPRDASAKPPKPSVHGHGRRLLLAAAGELFAERGYGGTSTRDIADRAGVSEPMLFRHFGNKATLFQEAAVTPFTEFMDQYIKEYRNRAHGQLSAAEEGRRFFDGLFRVLFAQRELLMALMSAHQFDEVADEISAQARDAFGLVLALFEEVVETEAEERGFADSDLPAMVRVMFSMALSVALHGDWLMIGGEVTYDRMLAAMTQMSVHGLRVPPRAD
jgi:AcrR family transcriptional regulator